MRRINVNLFPKEGYLFIDADGHKVTGKSWPNVMAKVQAYRKRSGRPVGDVESEVLAQACTRNPGFCTENRNNEPFLQSSSLKVRILRYLSFIHKLGSRLPWVNPREVEARANTCASCPFNSPLPEGCASCRSAVRAMQKEILGKRNIDARLNGCLILGESIPVSIYVDHDVVDKPELPAHCWRKQKPPA